MCGIALKAQPAQLLAAPQLRFETSLFPSRALVRKVKPECRSTTLRIFASS